MSNPADEQIAKMIRELIKDYDRCFSSEEELKDKIISRIAKLRKSMEPTQQITEK